MWNWWRWSKFTEYFYCFGNCLSSMGVKVAKHGNKAVSSNCGSADVLEALNIKINLNPKEAEEGIRKI